MLATHPAVHQPGRTMTLVERLNGPRHELALRVFMVIVLAHWAEHLLQAFQIYALGWPVPESRGALGYFFPWLVKSETLHYGYALVMLAGLWLLRSGFTGVNDRRWWTIALAIQFFHHIEHALLQTQAILGHNFFGSRSRRASCSSGCLGSSCTSSTTRSCSSRWSSRCTFTCFRHRPEAATQKCSCALAPPPSPRGRVTRARFFVSSSPQPAARVAACSRQPAVAEDVSVEWTITPRPPVAGAAALAELTLARRRAQAGSRRQAAGRGAHVASRNGARDRHGRRARRRRLPDSRCGSRCAETGSCS